MSTRTIASAGSVTTSSITVVGGGGGAGIEAGSDGPGFAESWAAGREGSGVVFDRIFHARPPPPARIRIAPSTTMAPLFFRRAALSAPGVIER